MNNAGTKVEGRAAVSCDIILVYFTNAQVCKPALNATTGPSRYRVPRMHRANGLDS